MKITQYSKAIYILCTSLLFSTFSYSQKVGVIGDFGDQSTTEELAVRDLIDDLNPDFIITTGDNNYLELSYQSYNENVGDYYGDFIDSGDFFPCIGNHDLVDYLDDSAYLSFFDLPAQPAKERYYDFVRGDIHFFCLNSNNYEPHGITENSTQAMWLKNKLATSTSLYKIVYLHHPPYSSRISHEPSLNLRWPFAAWGANAVMAGHNHYYERLLADGIPYYVNGVGGRPIYDDVVCSTCADTSCQTCVDTSCETCQAIESQTLINQDELYGAMLIDANSTNMDIAFHSVDLNNNNLFQLEDIITIPAPPASNNITVDESITSGSNDAEEEYGSNDSPYLGSNTLDLNYRFERQHVGLRFKNLNIPQGANIVNAHVEFTAKNSDGNYHINIHSEVTGNAPSFSSTKKIKDRINQNNNPVEWDNPDSEWKTNEIVSTPDLSAIIQEVVNQGSWSPNNNLALIFEGVSGSGSRKAYSRNSSYSKAPRLFVTYNTISCTETFEKQISSGYHDAEERVSDGDMNRTSTDLEFGEDYSTEQKIGLRFSGVNIPQGATICDARIEFTAEGTTDDNFTVRVKGQGAPNMYGFYNSDDDISDRPKTNANVDWDFGSDVWVNNLSVETPNLSPIVQEIVSDNQWNSGNNVYFFFENISGIGTRRVYSYDDHHSRAANLIVTYDNSNGRVAPEINETITFNNGTARKPILFPNPIKEGAAFNIDLDHSMLKNPIKITIYDTFGKLVANHDYQEYHHQIVIPGDKLKTGIYLVKIQSGQFEETAKLLVYL